MGSRRLQHFPGHGLAGLAQSTGRDGLDLWPQVASAGIVEQGAKMGRGPISIPLANDGHGRENDFLEWQFSGTGTILWTTFLLDIKRVRNHVEQGVQHGLQIAFC